jgi:crotonobetainyl-CoA:carnitine CoA-transferase CaiB-like acyl-CoA transferase
MSALPLSGIKILDLTRVLAGPLSAQMLGDLGADVIKIERPGTGDDARAFGPPYLVDPAGKDNNNNSFYLCANRNKRSVTVNVASPEGQEIIRELAKGVDVFMENYKFGDLKRYGLDYESIKAINPGIIYCSVTGFGQTGPYAPRAGYDAILQAMGGLMSVTGHIDGEPGEGPMKVGPSIVDYMTGMNTSIGILSALYHRDANGGEGQHIDVCLFDTVIASLSHWLQIYLVNGKVPPRRGTWGNGGMPAGVFRATDGELMVVVGNDGQFAHLRGARRARARDRSEIPQEQRPRQARQGNHGDLCRPVPEEAGEVLAGRTGEGWRALRSHQRFRAGVFRPARPGARHAGEGQPSFRARPVSVSQRGDILRHAGEGVSLPAAARRAHERGAGRHRL